MEYERVITRTNKHPVYIKKIQKTSIYNYGKINNSCKLV